MLARSIEDCFETHEMKKKVTAKTSATIMFMLSCVYPSWRPVMLETSASSTGVQNSHSPYLRKNGKLPDARNAMTGDVNVAQIVKP